MEKIVYLLIGAMTTWGLYFIQRLLEQRRTTEVIDRNQKLLALMQDLEGAQTSLEDLKQFETKLIGKAETAARIADSYFTKAEEVGRLDEEAATQADMTQHSVNEYRKVDARLQALVVHIRRQLDGESLRKFDEAQQAWLEFRERYASFIALVYASGSIRPLIHAVTLESITANWINELETQLGDDT